MAWRDRLRRRAAAPDSADRPGTERSGAAPSGPSGDGPDPGAPGDPGPSVPGDWDGGWRRTAPPQLTVARAPLGVSDGLVFRAGLASWQNPSFDSGLGHAVLSAAPTGVVRGVARPATPRATRAGGGPLLLRALRPEGADAAGDGTPDAGSPAPLAARPSAGGSDGAGTADAGSGGNSTAGKGSSGGAPRTRGLMSTDSPATLPAPSPPVQRAARPGTDPVVAPAGTGRPTAAPALPPVRRVSVLPVVAAAGGGMSRPAPEAPSGTGGRTTSGPVVQRAAAQPARDGGQPEVSRPAVRPGPVGPSLTAARRPSGPVRRVTALRPLATPAPVQRAPLGTSPSELPSTAAPLAHGAPTPAPHAAASGPALPVVQRQAEDAADTADTPRRYEASRAPLGTSSGELPSTAAPSAEDAPAPHAAASGPALPVVQRQAEDAADTADTPRRYDDGPTGTAHSAPDGARVRGGLGAPLSALPPSADLTGTAASTGPAPGPALPVVQRQTDSTTSTQQPHNHGPKGTAHGTPDGARVRGGLGAPLSALPPSADLPGTTASAPDVQRAPARQDRGSRATPAAPAADRGGTSPGAAPGAWGADAPLLGAGEVQRRLADHSSAGGATPQGPADHASGPATPLVTPSPAAPAGTEGPAGDAGTVGPPAVKSSGRRTPTSASPAPVVVARAAAEAAGGDRPHSARPLTVTRSGAHSAPAAPRTLQLLPARPLALSTRAPEGVTPPAAVRPGGRPVVAARWPGAPAASPGGTAPTAGAPARPTPHPSAPAPASVNPPVQRAAAAAPGSADSGVPSAGSASAAGSAPPVRRVPVVRPAQPRTATAGAAPAVPARPLPVTAPQAPPLADRPSAATAPVETVPVVRPRAVMPGGAGRAATPVQRATTGTGGAGLLKDVPVKAEPAKAPPAHGRSRSSSGSSASPSSSASSASGKGAARRPGTPQDDPGLDLDDLARRLLDPMARLLRTELRRGRERTGRPYDGRR